MTTFSFNGQDFSELMVVNDIRRPLLSPVSNTFTDVGSQKGVIFSYNKYAEKTIEVDFTVIAKDSAALQVIKQRIAGFLYTATPQQLLFSDEPDRYYLAVIEGSFEVEQIGGIGQGSITFIVPAGVSYALEPRQFPAVATNGILTATIVNNGTEVAPLSFKATMTDDNGFLGAVSPLGAMEFGNISDVDGYTDMSERVFKYQIHPLDEASFAKNNGVINWKLSNGGDTNKQQGAFNFTGEVALASDFGTVQTNSSWYGPSLSEAIPAKTSDGLSTGNWKVHQWLVHKAKGNSRKLGRQEINLSNGVESIVSFVIYDDSVTAVNTKIEFWLFGVKVKRVVLDKAWSEFYGSIDIWKEGDTIYFKLYHFDSKQTMNFSFSDERISESSVDKWTYWVSKYRNNQTCEMSLNYLDFQWIGSQNFVDVPNRYMAGDILHYDGDSGKFYVNRGEGEELALDDIVQGSTDIKVPAGTWTVEFFYSEFSETPPTIIAEIKERWI